MTFLEGLGDSCLPCAHLLSVAGLLVIISLFLPGRSVYSEERKARFLAGIAYPG